MNRSVQKEIEELFKRQPVFFIFYLSKNFSLDMDLLTFLQDDLRWGFVSCNQNINFTIELINAFKKRWYWRDLSSNKTVMQSPDILNHFKRLSRYKHEEEDLSSDDPDSCYHPNIRYHKYSLTEIEEKKEKISWSHLSSNEHMNWNYTFLEKYRDYFWFGNNKNENSFSTNGMELYSNEAVPWDIDTLLLFEEKLFNHTGDIMSFVWNKTLAKNLNPFIDKQMVSNILSK